MTTPTPIPDPSFNINFNFSFDPGKTVALCLWAYLAYDIGKLVIAS